MKITYWSDFACPYCYIGNLRLEKAIAELGLEDEVEFDVRAFELDSNASMDVESTTVERFAMKYGLSIQDAEKEVDNISKLGIEDGIDFRYASTLYTNTRDAHRLMKLAQSKDDVELAERLGKLLFDAYFTKNLKLADRQVLLDIACEAGMDKGELIQVLDSDLFNSEVENDEALAISLGIHAVPFYLLDGKYSVPGVLSYEDFKAVLGQIMDENDVDGDRKTDSCEDGICRI